MPIINRRQGTKLLLAGLAQMALPMGARAQGEKYGGTMVVGLATEPRIVNPGFTTDFYSNVISGTIYNKLVSLDREYKAQPELASAWTISADGQTYTFTLARNVKWHDGQPLNSADVKFSLEKIVSVYLGVGQAVMKNVESVAAPDDNTVIITLKQPYDPMMTFLGYQGYILPRHVFEGTDISQNQANSRPVGSGAFRMTDWQRGNSITLERNKEYFVAAEPYLDRVVFKFLPDPNARLRALETGEIDYVAAYDLPTTAIVRLRQSPTIAVTSEGHENWASVTELMMNTDKAPYGDKRVRQAISHAIDRDYINAKACYGLFRPATGPISSETAWAYNRDVKRYSLDPGFANKLLDEAGVARQADGTRFTARLVAARGVDAFAKSCEIIAEQLKAVGINIQVSILDKPAVLDLVYVRRDFDMFLHSLSTGPDPAIGVERQYVSANVRPLPFTNAAGYRNPTVDDLFARAAREGSRDARARLYRDVQSVLVEDAAVVWLYEDVTYSAYRKEFQRMHSWSPDSNYFYNKVWWIKGPRASI